MFCFIEVIVHDERAPTARWSTMNEVAVVLERIMLAQTKNISLRK
jgi:hypothetical protein